MSGLSAEARRKGGAAHRRVATLDGSAGKKLSEQSRESCRHDATFVDGALSRCRDRGRGMVGVLGDSHETGRASEVGMQVETKEVQQKRDVCLQIVSGAVGGTPRDREQVGIKMVWR